MNAATPLQGITCGIRFYPSVRGNKNEATPLQRFNCGTRFYPSVEGVQHEASLLQGFTWYPRFYPVCRVSIMRRHPHNGSTVIHTSTPVCSASTMRRVRGRRTKDSFKRLLLCHFSPTGRNFTRLCQVLPKDYRPQWIAPRIEPLGHGSLLCDDAWYAMYSDYRDLLGHLKTNCQITVAGNAV